MFTLHAVRTTSCPPLLRNGSQHARQGRIVGESPLTCMRSDIEDYHSMLNGPTRPDPILSCFNQHQLGQCKETVAVPEDLSRRQVVADRTIAAATQCSEPKTSHKVFAALQTARCTPSKQLANTGTLGMFATGLRFESLRPREHVKGRIANCTPVLQSRNSVQSQQTALRLPQRALTVRSCSWSCPPPRCSTPQPRLLPQRRPSLVCSASQGLVMLGFNFDLKDQLAFYGRCAAALAAVGLA